jgi:hypothetical protein
MFMYGRWVSFAVYLADNRQYYLCIKFHYVLGCVFLYLFWNCAYLSMPIRCFPYSFLLYSTRAEYRSEGIQREIAVQLEVSSKSLKWTTTTARAFGRIWNTIWRVKSHE